MQKPKRAEQEGLRRPQHRYQRELEERQDEYETRTEWHRVYAWGNLANFAKTLRRAARQLEEDQVLGRSRKMSSASRSSTQSLRSTLPA